MHTGLPALAAAAFSAWATLLAGASTAFASVLAVLVAMLAAAAAGVGAGFRPFRHAQPPGAQLQWNGQRWSADGTPGRLQLMMDLEGLLVLRLHLDGGGARWLAVSAADAGPAWQALRAAVHSRPPRATPRALAPERGTD